MQPTRRWILGAAGLLVAAPSIVRASSLMAMPRAQVIMPPEMLTALWLEFVDVFTGKVCRVPCVQRNDPRVSLRVETDLGIGPTTVHSHIDLMCKAPQTIWAHEVRVGRGYEPAIITYKPPGGIPLCYGSDVNLGVDIVSPGRPGVSDFEVKMHRTLLAHLRGGG